MQRSLSSLFYACVFAGSAAIAATLDAAPVAAETMTTYEPSFLRQADRALRRGNAERALSVVESNLQRELKDTHRADAHGIACRAHLEMNAPDLARTECQSAMALDSSRSRWRYLNNLGVAELELGDYDAAEQAFSNAAALSGPAATPRRNLQVLHELRETRDQLGDEQVAAVTLSY